MSCRLPGPRESLGVMWRWIVVLAASCSFSTTVTSESVPSDGDGPPVDSPKCAGTDSDGDGVNDPCDACPNDNPDDSDGDGVCNSADTCAQGPDNKDADSDGIADACDDWPCGVKPAAPSAVVTWVSGAENVTLSGIDISTAGQRAVVAAGAMVSVTAGYNIVDCVCPGCIDQIEIGFHTSGKAACLYNGNPNGNGNCMTPTTGVATRTITAPATPGVYELRFNRGNDNSCQNNGAWWANVAPGAGNTFALVCVR